MAPPDMQCCFCGILYRPVLKHRNLKPKVIIFKCYNLLNINVLHFFNESFDYIERNGGN